MGSGVSVFGPAFSCVCVLLPVCGVKGLGLVVVLLLFYCVVLCLVGIMLRPLFMV